MSQIKTKVDPKAAEVKEALERASGIDKQIFKKASGGKAGPIDLKYSAGEGFGKSADVEAAKKAFTKAVKPKEEASAEEPVKESAEESTPEPVAEEPVKEEAPVEEPVKEESAAEPALTKEMVNETIRQTLALINEQTIAPLQEKVVSEAQQREALSAQLAEAQKNLAEKEATIKKQESDLTVFQDLTKLTGLGAPSQPVAPAEAPKTLHIARQSNPFGLKMEGAFAEFMQHMGSMPTLKRGSTKTGKVEALYNTAEVDGFVRANKQAFMQSLETAMKSAELLGGGSFSRGVSQGYNSFTQAPSSKADIIGGFLPALSSLMRMNNKPGGIWWQFANTEINFMRGAGDTIQVPRVAYQANRPATTADRRLSGNGVYVPISATNQPIASATVDIILQENGLGKDAANGPIGINAFTEKYSLISLMEYIRRNLWFDYNVWEDIAIYEQFEQTTRVVYNNNGSPVATAAELTAGYQGHAGYEFITGLSSYAKSQEIPPFDDGCYVYCVPTTAIPALRKDLDAFLRTENKTDPMLVRDIVMSNTGRSDDFRVEGYVGKIANVHVFEGNSWGTGLPGTRGVQTENDGAGAAQTFRSGYFFGPGAVARGVGQDFQITTRSGEVNWNRLIECIWTSHEEFAPLDIDPAVNADHQLRVIETRTTDAAVA